MLGRNRHDHHRVFGALGLVDRRCVAEDQFIEFAKRIGDHPTVEGHGKLLVVSIDASDETDVAVEDVAVVVVLDLHDLVADAEAIAELVHTVFAGRIQRRLQGLVDATGAGDSPVHRAEHLDVTNGIDMELPGQARLHQIDDGLRDDFRLFGGDEVEIRSFALARQTGKDAPIDLVSTPHNARTRRLAKHFGQPDDGHATGVDQIRQELSGADRG